MTATDPGRVKNRWIALEHVNFRRRGGAFPVLGSNVIVISFCRTASPAVVLGVVWGFMRGRDFIMLSGVVPTRSAASLVVSHSARVFVFVILRY